MVLKSISEMCDVKHGNNVLQSYAFDSVLQFKKKDFYFTEDQKRHLEAHNKTHEDIDMHIKSLGYLDEKDVLKKQTQFESMCEDAHGDKVCPTNKEMLL